MGMSVEEAVGLALDGNEDDQKYALELDKQRIEEARKAGFIIVQGDDNTLLLDLDTPESRHQFNAMLPMVHDRFNVKDYQTWSSKSGNTHVRLTIEKCATPMERLLLQAVLGSDVKRELLGMLKIRAAISDDPSVLFKPPMPDFK